MKNLSIENKLQIAIRKYPTAKAQDICLALVFLLCHEFLKPYTNYEDYSQYIELLLLGQEGLLLLCLDLVLLGEQFLCK